jgi:hypothetical protein
MAEHGRNELPYERLIVRAEGYRSELVVGVRSKVGLAVFPVHSSMLERQRPAGPVLRSHMNLVAAATSL